MELKQDKKQGKNKEKREIKRKRESPQSTNHSQGGMTLWSPRKLAEPGLHALPKGKESGGQPQPWQEAVP